LPQKAALIVLSLGLPANQDLDDEAKKRINESVQDETTKELKGELRTLARHLNALATLVDAAAKFRSEFSSGKEAVGHAPVPERDHQA
jgi:hypothetical protein